LALRKAIELRPDVAESARESEELASLRDVTEFRQLVGG
jgi:hypothetical protein